MSNFDVIVIGQGYTGLKVAKLAAARGLRTAVSEKMFPGGLIMSINHLDPVPEGEEPCGPDVTSTLAMENMDAGIESIEGTVNALSPAPGGGWTLDTDAGTFTAPDVVIASGARLRKLGVAGEEEFAGRGVSECADCDGPLYHGKEAVVIGGGDSAFQEAAALTQYASKVTIVMRGPAPRARADLVAAVEVNAAITVMANASVEEIVGDTSGVTGVRLDNGETLPCSVIFAFVGLVPDVGFAPVELERDAGGALVASDAGVTSLPGLWVAGAARSGFGGTLLDATADAERVAAAL